MWLGTNNWDLETYRNKLEKYFFYNHRPLLNVLCQVDVLIQSQLIWNLQIALRSVCMVVRQILNVLGK